MSIYSHKGYNQHKRLQRSHLAVIYSSQMFLPPAQLAMFFFCAGHLIAYIRGNPADFSLTLMKIWPINAQTSDISQMILSSFFQILFFQYLEFMIYVNTHLIFGKRIEYNTNYLLVPLLYFLMKFSMLTHWGRDKIDTNCSKMFHLD